jgi:regulator of protease activity HflC (stomatin/prohibitin superfamily)
MEDLMSWDDTARNQHSRCGDRYPSDLTDREWALIAPLLPPAKRGGRPRTTKLRAVTNAKLVDTRWTVHDVAGQEVLTADRVTTRVNIAAAYRVTDPVKAASTVSDFVVALHQALQFAFRKTLGTRSLDQLLAEKVSVDAEAADKVRAEMAQIGIEVGEIALKDVILPGEMREILNRVVAVSKEAEANVIRRREETAATRALLNTARVMAENPVMLPLKALDAIAGKVERLTVHNGTGGLMNDLVRLRD